MTNISTESKLPQIKEPTGRYSLNSKQIHLLKLTYKFRYVTSSLIASYKGISRVSANKSLKILLERGYLGQKYNNRYRIQGKGPRYYLVPKALKLLRNEYKLNPKALHNMYKNKSLSSAFINHNLDVFSVYLGLRDKYPEVFSVFTRVELTPYDYFPTPKPDLYLNRHKKTSELTNEYILNIFSNVPLFIIKKRLDNLIRHYDSGDWEATTEGDYPAILLVCANIRTENSLRKHTYLNLENRGIDELRIYSTTTYKLTSPETSKLIWQDIYESKRLVSL